MGKRSNPYPADIVNWDKQFSIQASWTKDLRDQLLSQVDITSNSIILEPGCGTGVILTGLPPCKPTGIDLNFKFLQTAQAKGLNRITCANAANMPFASGSIDLVITHYFFLWVEPARILQEIIRVLKPGSACIAFAEPSHAHRIDFPPPMDQLGRLQTNALIDQGADPHAGVRLRGEFEAAGLTNVTAGVIGGEWCDANDRWNLSEWQILQRDLNGSLPEERFAEFAEIDKKSRSNGSRILFIPTFYAAGFKP